ncbi:MAG: universal stress protein [Actinomycetia bacterium]|jgi:nucleotide-binding universal stress UspA family protein|nr:universal stress protein [Actinomycetes bacterium]
MIIRPVVVGYDGSLASRRALDWALREAELRDLPLEVVHAHQVPLTPVPMAVEYSPPSVEVIRAAGEAVLAEATAYARERRLHGRVSTRLVVAPPAVTLIDAGEDAAMVVVGARGVGGFAELLVGSTAMQVAMHAACPTVVVPHERPAAAPPGPGAGRVVVGVDGSPLSASALEFAFEEAALRGTGLTVVHAWEAPFFDRPAGKGPTLPPEVVEEDLRAQADDEHRLLDEVLTGWVDKYPEVDATPVLLHDKPAAALVALSVGAELLVVGSRGRGGFATLLLGSVSHPVLHHAACPVAVVRNVRR